jgi:hypothetical protein
MKDRTAHVGFRTLVFGMPEPSKASLFSGAETTRTTGLSILVDTRIIEGHGLLMSTRTTLLLLSGLTLWAPACAGPEVPKTETPEPTAYNYRMPPTPVTADVILRNAHVITMNPEQPHAEAVAISGNTIVAVGTEEEVMAWRDSQTTVENLEGRTVLPGFIAPQNQTIERSLWEARKATPPSKLEKQNGLRDEMLVALDEAQSELAKAGVTTVEEVNLGALGLNTLRTAANQGQLKLDVVGRTDATKTRDLKKEGTPIGLYAGRLKLDPQPSSGNPPSSHESTLDVIRRAAKPGSDSQAIMRTLRNLTVVAAEENIQEPNKGSIANGKVADLVVLSANPLTASQSELSGLAVLQTIKEGRIIYRIEPESP